MKEVISAYNLPPDAKFELLRQMPDNLVYKVSAGKQAYALRLGQTKKHNDLPFELELLIHLSKTLPVPVPKPVPTAQGELFVKINHQTATLFEWLPGQTREVTADSKPSLTLVSQAGRLLGQIHAASSTFQPRHQTSRKVDTEIKRAIANAAYITKYFTGGAQFIKECKAVLQWQQAQPVNVGILHHDFIPSNLLIMDDKVSAVLDFDWSCLGPVGKDVGLGLATWSLPDDQTKPWPDVYATFLEGYNTTAPVKVDDKTARGYIRYALLSDAATFFSMLNEKREYDPGEPITRVAQCRRYRKMAGF